MQRVRWREERPDWSSDSMTGHSQQSKPRVWLAMRKEAVGDVAKASDSYGLLLGLVVIDYLMLSVDWTRGWPTIASTALIGLTALLAFHTSHVRGKPLRVVQVAVVVAMVAATTSSLFGGDVGRGTVFVLCALLILTSPIAVLSRILGQERVTVETLLGAVSVYILLGLLFACADLAVQLLSGHSFFTQPGKFDAADFVYFSFITMTTVGYGDLSPTVGFPRTMAVTEALAGQIFLVVTVARLVSMYQRTDRGERRRVIRGGTPERVEDP
jgi:Ion channel